MSVATPSPSLLANLDTWLQRHVPFSQMAVEDRLAFLADAEKLYYAPDEVIVGPDTGIVGHLYLVERGAVVGEGHFGIAAPFALEAGELFPVGAMLAHRAVTSVYRASGDTFCLRVPAARVTALAARSAPFAEHLNRRMLQLVELSRQALQGRFASRIADAEHTLEEPLSHFVRAEPPLAVPPSTPLGEALAAMRERRVGSVLVVDDAGGVAGILTRHDLLERVVLAQRPLATPVAEVMSAPVHTLDAGQRAHDAAMVMSSEGVRHVPITDGGKVVGIVSERDLFTLQRLSLRHLGAAIDGASDTRLLVEAGADIRRFAAKLLAQGAHARTLTELVSHLNDRLAARLVTLTAEAHGLDLRQACWLAFGSEGRAEQTIATDQDNGIVFAAGERTRWLAFGRAVNQALDACGYPLCRGGIMAGEPDCCLSADEWSARFVHWIDHGAPADLLRASIFFDLRPVAGATALAQPLRGLITDRAAATPRFLRQMAENALQHGPPLAWHGAIGTETIDLKMQGTALFVEAARLIALATGVPDTGTVPRLQAAGVRLGVPEGEVAAWVTGFEYLQLLRLGVQAGGATGEDANRCRVDALNAIDRRVLRETLRAARGLQQRIELDYLR